MNLLFTLFAFLLALGILIVVHELGHFWVARWCGVKVLRFSVGFGKTLWVRKSKVDGTEWALAAFPLGGFVKMLDEREGEVAPHELPRAFNRQTVWRRILIVVAGPLANLLLAVVLYWILFLHGVPGVKPMLGEPPAASPAAAAGFRSGEIMTAIDGEAVVTWQDARWLLLKRVMKQQVIKIETHNEGGEIQYRTLAAVSLSADDLEGDFLEKLGLTPFHPLVRPVIGKLLPGGAGERAGLQEKDEIVAVNGKSVARWEDLVQWVRDHPDRKLVFDVLRGGSNSRRRWCLLPKHSRAKWWARSVPRLKLDPELGKKLLTEVRYPPLQALGACAG